MAIKLKDPSIYIVVMGDEASEVVTISPGANATYENGWANAHGDFDPDPWAFADEKIAASRGYFPATRRTYTMVDAKGSGREMSRLWNHSSTNI